MAEMRLPPSSGMAAYAADKTAVTDQANNVQSAEAGSNNPGREAWMRARMASLIGEVSVMAKRPAGHLLEQRPPFHHGFPHLTMMNCGPQEIHLGPMQVNSLGPMPQGNSLGPMPQGNPLGSMPQAPQGNPLGSMPQGNPLGSMPQGIPLGPMPQGNPLGSMPQGLLPQGSLTPMSMGFASLAPQPQQPFAGNLLPVAPAISLPAPPVPPAVPTNVRQAQAAKTTHKRPRASDVSAKEEPPKHSKQRAHANPQQAPGAPRPSANAPSDHPSVPLPTFPSFAEVVPFPAASTPATAAASTSDDVLRDGAPSPSLPDLDLGQNDRAPSLDWVLRQQLANPRGGVQAGPLAGLSLSRSISGPVELPLSYLALSRSVSGTISLDDEDGRATAQAAALLFNLSPAASPLLSNSVSPGTRMPSYDLSGGEGLSKSSARQEAVERVDEALEAARAEAREAARAEVRVQAEAARAEAKVETGSDARPDRMPSLWELQNDSPKPGTTPPTEKPSVTPTPLGNGSMLTGAPPEAPHDGLPFWNRSDRH